MSLISSNDRKRFLEGSCCQGMSAKRIYCNFYAPFVFIVTICAKILSAMRCPDIYFAMSVCIKNHHVFSTTLSNEFAEACARVPLIIAEMTSISHKLYPTSSNNASR